MKNKLISTVIMCSLGLTAIVFAPERFEKASADYDFQRAYITYNLDGGVFNSSAPTVIDKGYEYTIPMPTKYGSKFSNWRITYSGLDDMLYDVFIGGMDYDYENNVCIIHDDYDVIDMAASYTEYRLTFTAEYDPDPVLSDKVESKNTLASIGFELDCFNKGWNLVTDISQVRENEKILIVSKDYDYAMNDCDYDSRICTKQVDFVNERNGIDESVLFNECIFTLVKGTEENTYALKSTNEFYIGSNGIDSNSMYAVRTLDSGCNINLSITEEGKTVLEFVGGTEYKYLRFDLNVENSFPSFLCDNSLDSYSDIQIYRYSRGVRKASIRFGKILSESDYNTLTALGTLGVEVSYVKESDTYKKTVLFNESTVAKVDSYGKPWIEGDAYYQFGITINGVEKDIEQEFTGKVFITDGTSKCYMQKRTVSFINLVDQYRNDEIYDYLSNEDKLLIDQLYTSIH